MDLWGVFSQNWGLEALEFKGKESSYGKNFAYENFFGGPAHFKN